LNQEEIKHLDDHIVNVSREGITQPGFVIKVNGEGMPKHQRSEKGDLHIKVKLTNNSIFKRQGLDLFLQKKFNSQ
jgi:DnaJ-class molecular chaperone